MLKKLRVCLAIAFWTGITLLFIDFSGVLHLWLGWMAKVQFLPAALALNAGVIIGLILLTIVLGRVYCSTICPLGVFQDGVAWLSVSRKRRHRNRRPYGYSPEKKWLRYGVLALYVLAIITGVQAFVVLLAPYGAYGRIVQNIFLPACTWGNNLLDDIAERAGSYATYPAEVWVRSLPTFAIAAATLVTTVILSWRNGRTWCNTICPVGATLGLLSRFSIMRPVIDPAKCKDCKACEHNCKASCIDVKEHKIDLSRCVDCFNCIDTCKFGALHYLPVWKMPRNASAGAKRADTRTDAGRRAFLTGVGIAAGAATIGAQEKKADGGLAVLTGKEIPGRKTHVTPPGSVSAKNMQSRCIACQLCVAECPNHVLRPSSSLERLMQPESSFERGWCRPECTRCSEVCPTGAILKIDKAQKSSIQAGHAVWLRWNCVPLTDGVECGNCARHCPSGAIIMVNSRPDDPTSVRIPAINEERCIGCGACEYLCPARPASAIYVEGHQEHRYI